MEGNRQKWEKRKAKNQECMEKRMRKERIVLTAAEKAKSGEFDQGLSN
jgi:hypothetical protein